MIKQLLCILFYYYYNLLPVINLFAYYIYLSQNIKKETINLGSVALIGN